jgi:ubiquinone/menaquinone biosynthesis C-methylase UbiE
MVESGSNIFEKRETVESWDYDYYHPIAERYYDRAVATMLRLMGAGPGDHVLDAGCGPGVHSIRAAKAGLQVHAVDISETMLREARRRVEDAGVADRVAFAREDLTALSLPTASYRYVFSWGVIIHIREIERALDELARVVQPGGRLALYVTNSSAWDFDLETLVRMLVRKPLRGLETLPMGQGMWYEYHGERLWLWRVNVQALTLYLESRGLRRVARVLGELSEVQRRVHGLLRNALLHANNLAYRLHLPAAPAATNLLVFEKAR